MPTQVPDASYCSASRNDQELRPEQVAPGVAFLASSQCDVSGIVLQASNGHFSTVQWRRSAGVDFGKTVATPEAIVDQWSMITGA